MYWVVHFVFDFGSLHAHLAAGGTKELPFVLYVSRGLAGSLVPQPETSLPIKGYSMKPTTVFRRFVNLLIPSLWCAALFSVSAAQTIVNAGTVRGVVSDKSGAVVREAAVVLLSRSTGQQEARTTNGAGIFVFPSEAVGAYTLEVSAAGFRQAIVEGVYVQVGQPTAVNVQLQPGASEESITVSGESPLLRAEDSDQSSVVDRELLEGLPLNGRRFLDFALLVPNATPDGQNGLVSFAGEQGGQDTGYANVNRAY